MSKEKFTQGEWAVSDGDISSLEYRYLIHMNGECQFGFDDTSQGQYESPLNKGEAEANAHLIAAAPDMYREIKSDIDTLIEFIKTLREYSNDWLFYNSELDRKQALLAKARGE